MIRRNGPKGFLLITQSDHAALAAKLAAHWGNERFPAPQPRESVITAVACHDAGWSMHDDRPTLNPERIPAAFYEMPAGAYTRLWVASVSAAAARGGAMAGLIVSWHFTGLARLASPDGQDEAVRNMLADFVTAQHLRQADYCIALGLSHSLADFPPEPASPRDADAVYNLWVLRMCDWLSLQLCDDRLPEALQPPPPVPKGPSCPAVQARWQDHRTLLLDPWPLDVPTLGVKISGQRVPAGQYRRASDLLRVYAAAASETLAYTLAASAALEC